MRPITRHLTSSAALLVLTHPVIASAAAPDFCVRQFEGASLAMSYDAIKAEWTRRGYQDVSPAALPGGRANQRLALEFSKNGGASFNNSGGMTLRWHAAEAGGPAIQYSESGTATAALGAGGWSNGKLFLDRQGEFCSSGATNTPELQCSTTSRNTRIDVKSPLRADNTQCIYTAVAAAMQRKTMVTESVMRQSLSSKRDDRLEAMRKHQTQ
jgi:hypothetical protein